MQQPRRHAGIGGVEQRSLPLDHIPVPVIRIGAEHFGCAGEEVGDDGINGYAAAGDHDARLAGRAKVAGEPFVGKRPGQGKRRIFFSQCTIRAHRQQTLAAALAPGADRNVGRWRPHVNQAAPQAFGQMAQLQIARERRMHAADQIETRSQRFRHCRQPARRHDAPRIGHADNHRPGASGIGLRGRHGRQFGRDGRIRQAVLANAFVSRPVAQTEGGLCEPGFGRVTQKKQIGSGKRRC